MGGKKIKKINLYKNDKEKLKKKMVKIAIVKINKFRFSVCLIIGYVGV